MCDEQTENNVNNIEKIRIVKFDRAIPTIQMLLLAAALILLAVALAGNNISRVFLALALFGVLATIAVKVRCLYRNGLTFEVEFLDQESRTRLALVAEEVPDTDENAVSENDTNPYESESENTEKPKHWTEVNYPDPDVELGLKEPPVEEDE